MYMWSLCLCDVQNWEMRRVGYTCLGSIRVMLLFLYCVHQPATNRSKSELSIHIPTNHEEHDEEHGTHQSRPSSRPSPFTAQLPLTLQALPFSPPASPSCSLISSGFSAPSTSCLLQNTRSGTPDSSSSESIVRSSVRDV